MANEKRLVYLDDILADLHEVVEAAKADPDEIMRMAEACTGTIIKHLEKFPTVDSVEVVLCGKCKFSDISMSIPCAYICRKEKSPCYKRTTCADFGCLYGERREGE